MDKPEFISMFSELLSNSDIEVESLLLLDNDMLQIQYTNGYSKELSIAYNSKLAIVKDVIRCISY